jgi:DNA (cytosine-5)-methyltransferase 1
LAWEPLGWKPAFFAEVEPFPCAVLMQKFGATKPKRVLEPDEADTEKEKKQRELWQKKIETFPEGGIIPNLGDFTKIAKEDYDGEIDLLVGGVPCQSWSLAGLRRGFDDPRGNLALEFARLADRLKTRWFCLENVLGLISQGHGEAFAEILSAFCGWEVEVPVLGKRKNGELVRGWKNSGIVTPAPGGYGLAWRTLDAQFVRVDGYPRAVPQRRRRIFLIGYLGSWEYPATVFFEPGCLRGDTPPQRQAGAGIARNLTASPGGVSGKEQQHTFIDEHGRPLNALSAKTLEAGDGDITRMEDPNLVCMAHGQGHAEALADQAPTLNCNHEAPIICNSIRMREGCGKGGKGPLLGDNISHTLGVGNDQTIICRESGQGFWQEDKASGTVKVNGAEPTTVVCYDARGNGPGDVSPNLTGGHADRVNDYMPVILEGKSYGIAENIINRKVKNGGNGIGVQEELQYTLNTSAPHGVCCFVKNDAARDYSENVAMTLRSQAEHAVSYRSTVRRLMPVECERLMGFPDGHTQIAWNGKPASECPDTPRYKACGNAFTVNCARWIGMRIQMVEDFINE